MRIAILTNEYPPHIYGGAGVHVNFLSKELAAMDVGRHLIKVLCFGEQNTSESNLTVQGMKVGFTFPFQEPRNMRLLETIFRNVLMTGTLKEVDIIHCHTWYTHLAGCLLRQLLGKPLVLTTHSLEPHRPWKEEQLGKGYHVSTWIKPPTKTRTASLPCPGPCVRMCMSSMACPGKRYRLFITASTWSGICRPLTRKLWPGTG